jgi:hypothetical protein
MKACNCAIPAMGGSCNGCPNKEEITLDDSFRPIEKDVEVYKSFSVNEYAKLMENLKKEPPSFTLFLKEEMQLNYQKIRLVEYLASVRTKGEKMLHLSLNKSV